MSYISQIHHPDPTCKHPLQVDVTMPTFTPREREMITVIALPHKVGAHRLGCSESNVKWLIGQITRKLGVTDRCGAIVRLASAGIAIEVRHQQ